MQCFKEVSLKSIDETDEIMIGEEVIEQVQEL